MLNHMSGYVIIAVWVSGIPLGVEESVEVPFTVTVDWTPYKVSPSGTSYGETVSSNLFKSVTAIPAEPSNIIDPFLLGRPVSVTTVVVKRPPPQ